MIVAFRKYRQVLLILILVLLALRRFAEASARRVVLSAVGAIVLVAVIYFMSTALRKSRKERDDVPKHPLGLE